MKQLSCHVWTGRSAPSKKNRFRAETQRRKERRVFNSVEVKGYGFFLFLHISRTPCENLGVRPSPRDKHFGLSETGGRVSEMPRGRPSTPYRIFAGCPSLGHLSWARKKGDKGHLPESLFLRFPLRSEWPLLVPGHLRLCARQAFADLFLRYYE